MRKHSRRELLKLTSAGAISLVCKNQERESKSNRAKQDNSVRSKRIPNYKTQNTEILFHSTTDYPAHWKNVYKRTMGHFAKRFGKVGPTHVFLIENDDWDSTENSDERNAAILTSTKQLRRKFCELHGQDSDGSHLELSTGNHWTSWSIEPVNVAITMTMMPSKDGEQFVIGPIHEYMHAIQIAFGYAQEAIDGNQMGHALWTGPAWWREGSAVIIAAQYAFQNPELFKDFEQPFTWRRFSSEMNRNLRFYKNEKTPLKEGVTHNDWQRLEPKKLVYPVIYAGGSIACAMLLEKAGSLENYMKFHPLVPKLGWKRAFEKHFQTTLPAFYKQFETRVEAAKVQTDLDKPEKNFFKFLQSIN